MLVTADFERQLAKNANDEQRDSEYDLPALHIFIGFYRKPASVLCKLPIPFDQKSGWKIAPSAKVAFYPILSVPYYSTEEFFCQGLFKIFFNFFSKRYCFLFPNVVV